MKKLNKFNKCIFKNTQENIDYLLKIGAVKFNVMKIDDYIELDGENIQLYLNINCITDDDIRSNKNFCEIYKGEMMTLIQINSIKKQKKLNDIMNLVSSNRQHYLKFLIGNDISIRFYFQFEDRKEYEGKWFIKSHAGKIYQEIDEKIAKRMIVDSECDFKEIIGQRIGNRYRKIVVENNENVNHYFEK